MLKYEKLKVKYDNLIRDTLDSNRRILIESFVDYYGEEYRSIIEKRYNEISFIYYIDWNTIDLVIREFIPIISNPEKYAVFTNFFNSKKKKQGNSTKLFKSSKDGSCLPDNLIGATNLSILNKDYMKNELFRICNRPSPANFNYGSVIHKDRIISFQILSLSERTIIHEINHAITRDNLVYIFGEDQQIKAIHKAGLSVDFSSQNRIERIIEELINEKASQEITKIFKEKGGDLSSFCYNIPFIYPYLENLYLVDEFYDTFKKYIKVARISDNKNELINRIGKTNYVNYIDMLNSYYSEDLSTIEQVKKEAQSKIKIIIEQMKSVANNSHTMSCQDLNDYYNILRNCGFKVKLLNQESVEQNNLLDSNKEKAKRR